MSFFTADDLVKPGCVVTQTGQSQKKVAWPDVAGDVSWGVVGVLSGQDVDTAYPIGSTIPVYIVGGLATVWVRARANAGAMVAGTPLMGSHATVDGQILIAADSATVFNAGIGRCTHWHDDIGSDSWVAVKLCGV